MLALHLNAHKIKAVIHVTSTPLNILNEVCPMKRLILMSLCVCLATPAFGDILLNQDAPGAAVNSPWNHYEGVGLDGIANNGDEIRVFAMTPVQVGAGGWELDSITTFYAVSPPAFSAIPGIGGTLDAYLHVVPAADLATYDPTAAGSITATRTNEKLNGGATGAITFTASGIGQTLSPGDYYMGLTPIIDPQITTNFSPNWKSTGTGGVAFLDASSASPISSVFPGADAFQPAAAGSWVDLSDDGGATTADLTILVEGTLIPLVGDLDGDGFVGINDLNIVLGAWNQNVPPGNPLADPSGDGFVGIDDLNEVLGNWNAGIPPIASAVPEPASAAVLGLGLLLVAKRRRSL